MGITISSSSGTEIFEGGAAIPVPSSAENLSHRPPSASPAPPRSGESAENYPRVVVVLDANTRIIECAAGIQWILQVRKRKGRYPWEGVSFFRTKTALLHAGRNHPALQALPDRFPE